MEGKTSEAETPSRGENKRKKDKQMQKTLSENMRDRRREGWEEKSQEIERRYKEAETAGRTSRHDGLQKKRLVFVWVMQTQNCSPNLFLLFPF